MICKEKKVQENTFYIVCVGKSPTWWTEKGQSSTFQFDNGVIPLSKFWNKNKMHAA